MITRVHNIKSMITYSLDLDDVVIHDIDSLIIENGYILKINDNTMKVFNE